MINQLDRQKIFSAVSAELNIKAENIIVLPTTTSTNDYCKQIAKKTKNKTIICIANEQTAGKGRHENQWLSPPGNNIYLSILTKQPRTQQQNYQNFSLLVAIATIKAIKTQLNALAKILVKWPNDIIYQNHKLAGILIETLPLDHQTFGLIIGIGLNLYLSPANKTQINQAAIDLQTIAGKPLNRNKMAGHLISEIVSLIQNHGKHEKYLKDWQKYDALLHKKITIETGNKIYTGIAEGITAHGELKLRTQNQKLLTFNSGHILPL